MKSQSKEKLRKKENMNVDHFKPTSFSFYIRRVQGGNNDTNTAADKSCATVVFDDLLDDYISEGKEFQSVMLSLLDYADSVGNVAKNTQNIRRVELYNELLSVIEAPSCRRRNPIRELVVFVHGEKDDERREFVFPIDDVEKARAIKELEDAQGVAPRILCETMLQQIVNRWETHLSKIVKIKYSNNPNLLTKDKVELSFEQLQSVDDLFSLRRLFLDKIVAKSMEGGIENHLKFFKDSKAFELDFAGLFSEVNRLKEISYHRNVVVHCDGIASERHCQKMKGICASQDVPKRGRRLKTDLKYVVESWDVVYAAGCVLTYLLMTRHIKSLKLVKAELGADAFMVNASFDAIKSKRYHAAQLMLEHSLVGVEKFDVGTLALRINLALVYKFTGNKKKFREIVNSNDWDSRDEKHRAMIAVLRGEFQTAYELLKDICKKEPLYLNNVYEWIVYEDLRNDANFAAQISKIRAFKSFKPNKDRMPILDFDAKPADVSKHFTTLLNAIVRHEGARRYE